MLLAATNGLGAALLVTAFALGLRHGVDVDHVAAISDLAATETSARRCMTVATVYAAGHALVVLALGSTAVLAGGALPAAVDAGMSRVVGATLVLLGGYVAYGLARHGAEFRMRSRWAVIGSLLRVLPSSRRGGAEMVIEHDHAHGPGHGHQHPETAPCAEERRACVTTATTHRHLHVHRGPIPPDPSQRRGIAAFGIGMLHGIGAETPTQVVLLVAAAGAGGALAGEALLVVFTLGLLASNTAIAVAASAGFLHAGRHGAVYVGIAAITAGFSLVLGVVYLLGLGALLPFLAG